MVTAEGWRVDEGGSRLIRVRQTSKDDVGAARPGQGVARERQKILAELGHVVEAKDGYHRLPSIARAGSHEQVVRERSHARAAALPASRLAQNHSADTRVPAALPQRTIALVASS